MLADVFKLTSEEKKRLSQFPVGQGLFFAGQNHVHIQVVASPTETGLITTNPDQVQQINAAEQAGIQIGHPKQAGQPASGQAEQVQGTIDLGNRLTPGSTGQ